MEKRILILFSFLSLAGDIVILNLLLTVFAVNGNSAYGSYNRSWVLVLLNVVWIFLVFIFRLNTLTRIKQRKKIASDVLVAVAAWFFFYFIVMMAVSGRLVFSAGFFLLIILVPVGILAWKLSLDSIARYLRKRGFNQRKILVIGYNGKIDALEDYLKNNPWSGYRYMGFIHEGECPPGALKGNYSEIEKNVCDLHIDELFLNMAVIPGQMHHSIVSLANKLHLGITLIPDFGDFPAFHHNYQRFDQMPVISVGTDQVSGAVNAIIKRSFDIFISLFIILVFISWLTPLIALLIRLDSKGPVFFRQKRTGLRNRTFTCLKFRTMVENIDADSLQASECDKRVTRFGKVLRRTSLDELPQFFNVLAGQMSVVGPRPHMLQHTEMYSRQIPAYLYRHRFRPGITGLAQVRGYRGETREIERMKARIEHDIYYIENWSFWLDIKIILITLGKLSRGELNAY